MKAYIRDIVKASVAKLEGVSELPEIQLQKPKSADHGDVATNVALMLAKQLGKNPRQIAQDIVNGLDYDAARIDAVEIAGPGFINFRFAANYLFDSLQAILDKGETYGKTEKYAGKKFQVEFVSANPTGPLTVGHGRNAVLGDTIARLFEWTGADVDREYYFNNAGRQMRVLGQSVQARYKQELGQDVDLPEGGYEGDYIVDIAKSMIDEHGESLLASDEYLPFKEKAEAEIFADIRKTLERMSITMDTYFNENTLYEDKSIFKVVDDLRAKGLVYEKDDATWLKTTEFGKDKDTVLIKRTGEPTYRLPDIAYHIKKLERGFDRCIDVFGADHIDTYPDVCNAVETLGFDKEKIDVLVYQFVTIVKDGKPFKMSTRKANFVTLDELMDEVGADVTRFFFLMRSPSTHLEFDISAAKEAGDKNPVFYLQYAHARIHSILRKVKETYSLEDKADLTVLKEEAEEALIKILLRFPEFITQAADNKEPHRLISYLNDVASAFTRFYHDCHIVGEEEAIVKGRAQLAFATATVLKNGLLILGIEAPEKM